jgi:hypothetical protein
MEAVSARYKTDYVLHFISSINPDRFERIWAAPKLAAVAPHHKAAIKSLGHYRRFLASPDGVFLEKLREVYGMHPSTGEISTLMASLSNISDAKPLSSGPNRGLGRIPLDDLGDITARDVAQFDSLLKTMEKNYREQSEMRDALFGHNKKKNTSPNGRRRKR